MFSIFTAEIFCVNIDGVGKKKHSQRLILVNSFNGCSRRTAETGFMLRSRLNHQDVNMFTWVGDILGCAVKIRENRSQMRRRLFLCHRRRSKHLWDVSSNAELT